jgi:hypothetical protein
MDAQKIKEMWEDGTLGKNKVDVLKAFLRTVSAMSVPPRLAQLFFFSSIPSAGVLTIIDCVASPRASLQAGKDDEAVLARGGRWVFQEDGWGEG